MENVLLRFSIPFLTACEDDSWQATVFDEALQPLVQYTIGILRLAIQCIHLCNGGHGKDSLNIEAFFEAGLLCIITPIVGKDVSCQQMLIPRILSNLPQLRYQMKM